jgi:acylphosphatase
MLEQASIAQMVVYSGRVQGVGFRFTAASIARRHRVAGSVRNLPDGGVELVVEGPRDEVRAMLQAVRDYWGDYIAHEEIDEIACSGYTHFEVRQ